MNKSPLQLALDFFALNKEISPFLVGNSMPSITFQAEYMNEQQLIDLLVFLKQEGGVLEDELERYRISGCENTSHFWYSIPFMKIHLGFMFQGEMPANLKVALDYLK